jgi:hypothetical protein
MSLTSNLLETRAVVKELTILAPSLANMTVNMITDNVRTVKVIMKGGTAASQSLTLLPQLLWEL